MKNMTVTAEEAWMAKAFENVAAARQWAQAAAKHYRHACAWHDRLTRPQPLDAAGATREVNAALGQTRAAIARCRTYAQAATDAARNGGQDISEELGEWLALATEVEAKLPLIQV